MAAAKPLRAVADGETRPKPPPKPRRKSVAEAADSGTHRELLVAMRERIARAVQDPECPPRDLASLTRRLQDISKEIDAIDLRAKEEADQDAVSNDEEWDAETL
jgi:hypothetical protein